MELSPGWASHCCLGLAQLTLVLRTGWLGIHPEEAVLLPAVPIGEVPSLARGLVTVSRFEWHF